MTLALLLIGAAWLSQKADDRRASRDPAYAKQRDEERKRAAAQERDIAEGKQRDEAVRLKNEADQKVARLKAEADQKDRRSAIIMSREFVKRRLKAPASADFQPTREAEALKQKDGSWAVMSWVDSQNSFGAKLRMKYVAILKPSGDSWQLVNLVTE